MKRALLLILSALAIQTAAGQDIPKFSTFQIGFVPPLSTNGREAALYTNVFSFNILAGVSCNESGFSFSTIASIVRHDIKGLHFSGIYNFVGNEGRGVLFGGVGNNVLGDYKGVQFGGIFNTAWDLEGVQFAGIINWSDLTRGVQLAGVMNKAHYTEGVQLAGVVNAAKNFKGIELAGAANVASDMDGLQLAGIVNTARNVRGIQIGGIANIGRDVAGIQAGTILNKARNMKGLQIGIINIARDNDYPVGLVNIIRNGEMAIGLNFNELYNLTATFRSGGKVLYGIIGGGINLRDNSQYIIEGGIGAHINCTRWFRINNELKTASLNDFSTESVLTASYALLPAFRIAGRVELFAGPTLNFMAGNNTAVSGVIPEKTIWKKSAPGKASALYIGYTFGIQFVFHR